MNIFMILKLILSSLFKNIFVYADDINKNVLELKSFYTFNTQWKYTVISSKLEYAITFQMMYFCYDKEFYQNGAIK